MLARAPCLALLCMRKLLLPEAASAQLARQYGRSHAAWLGQAPIPVSTSAYAPAPAPAPASAPATAPTPTRWPLLLPLGQPTEADAATEPEAVRAWVQAWLAWPGPGTLQWVTRQWSRLGRQRLPQTLVLDGPEALADVAGQGARWRRAAARHATLQQAWPALQGAATGQRLFDALADFHDSDMARLAALLRWLAAHPRSGLYLRQLPVPGLDTKWVEQRKALILDLLCLPGRLPGGLAEGPTDGVTDGPPDGPRDGPEHGPTDGPTDGPKDRPHDGLGNGPESGLAGGPAARTDAVMPAAGALSGRDLHSWLGLLRPPARLRLRILCPLLQRQLGGLSDVEAPLHDLGRWPLAPQQVLVVENLESGLALPPLAGTVAVLKLGHAVGQLRQLPWLAQARVLYWGDIDTHGFAMLHKARQAWLQTTSLLMDAATLLAHRDLCVDEPQPYSGPPLDMLRNSEREVFDGLAQGRWGVRLRLEQERLPWGVVLAALQGLQELQGPQALHAPRR